MLPKLKDICKYRLEKSREELKAAQILFKEGLYSQTLNRSCYAIFSAVRALLLMDEFESRKHPELISYFNKNYAAAGIFEKKYSIILAEAEWVKNKSDYRDFYIASKDSAEEQIKNGSEFIQKMEEYINSRLATIDVD